MPNLSPKDLPVTGIWFCRNGPLRHAVIIIIISHCYQYGKVEDFTTTLLAFENDIYTQSWSTGMTYEREEGGREGKVY